MRGEENLKFFLRCFVYFSIGVAVFQEVANFNASPPTQQHPSQPPNDTRHYQEEPKPKRPAEPALPRPSQNDHFGETVVLLVQYCKS